MELAKALALIRVVPDFPKSGIIFQDITPLLADPAAFSSVISEMAKSLEDVDIVA